MPAFAATVGPRYRSAGGCLVRPRDPIETEPVPSVPSGQRTSQGSDRFGLRVAHVSDRGSKRTNNEDAVLVLRLIRDGGGGTVDSRLLAVADGMGGMERGEIASHLALTALSSYVADRFGDVPEDDVPGQIELLTNALAAVNERVHASQDPRSASKMGSTIVVAYTAGSALFVAHAGDSRCYLLRDGGIQRATRDDSLVQALIDAGQLTEAEAAVHPQRNRISKGIGLVPPDRFQPTVRHVGDVNDYDYVLLSSDGLHGVVKDDEIARAVYGSRNAASAAKALLALAIQAGAPDNVSVILARVVPGESAAKGTPPRATET